MVPADAPAKPGASPPPAPSMIALNTQGSSPSTIHRCQVPRWMTQPPAPSSTEWSFSSKRIRPEMISMKSMVSVA